MSEEKKLLSSLFAQVQQTYEEAVEKRESEKTSARVDRFRTPEDGEYKVRVLPLAPTLDENGNVVDMPRKGYEYPVQQQFIKIKLPSKDGKKAKFIQIPVVRTTQKGVDLPVDIIDTYVKIAKEYDDEEVTKKVGENSYSGGLKWNYQHAMYVLDVNKGRKGPLLYTCSGSQYHSLEEEKWNIWNQLKENNVQRDDTCPICGFSSGYILTVKRYEESKQTKYKFSLNAIGGPDSLKEEELNALLKAPRIPDEIYRYTRYQFEATLEFLKQYDETLELDVCQQDDFKEAVEQLRAALPSDDTSHFSLADAGKDKKDSGKSEEITLDSLFAELDAIDQQGLGKKSDEYLELREKITQFVQDNNLDIRFKHSDTCGQILEEIEDLMDNNASQTKSEDKHDDGHAAKENDDEQAPNKRRKRPSDEDSREENAGNGGDNTADNVGDENDPTDEPKPDHEPEPRRRRQRPSDENEPGGDGVSDDEGGDNNHSDDEEMPRRRRRR